MLEDKMINGEVLTETMPSGTAAEIGTKQTQQDWVTPQFECIPLTEAMGPMLNHVASDGANAYS